MKRNKKYLKYCKERVILSDTLPYELPLTFSNHDLYNFLVSNKIELSGNRIQWNAGTPALSQVVRLLFSSESDVSTIQTMKINLSESIECKGFRIPFCYKINRQENSFRDLSIVHPKDQLAMIDYYHVYKDLIFYYCEASAFSIRKPYRVAKYFYHKDKVHYDNIANAEKVVADAKKGIVHESMKSFFAYKKYDNIHEFYESYDYHRCEQKYDRMIKFDISKCFDSIYTHTVCWALMNRDIVKECLSGHRCETFAAKFDRLMMNLNHSETHGIVIGPEFSRIFAELILQSIDVKVEKALKLNSGRGLFHKRDYEIFRYIDDYFVFYNDERVKDEVMKEFHLELKNFKLFVNDLKTIPYAKPIITNITIAKQKIADLLGQDLSCKLKDGKLESNENMTSEDCIGAYCSNVLITKIKTIIKETEVEYKDVLNYVLAIIERKTTEIAEEYILCSADFRLRDFDIESFKNGYKKQYAVLGEILAKNNISEDDVSLITNKQLMQSFNELLNVPNLLSLIDNNKGLPSKQNGRVNSIIRRANKKRIVEILPKGSVKIRWTISEYSYVKASLIILDIVFFLYAVSPRVNTTIKLCRILRVLTEVLKNGHVKTDFKHLIFKKIYDNIYFILKKNKTLQHTQVETLYLLVALDELGKEYRLPAEEVCAYFGIINKSGTLVGDVKLNYISIVVLLFYIKDKKRYDQLRDYIKQYVAEIFSEDQHNLGMKAELVLLLFDIITCPFIDNDFKKKLLGMRGIKTATEQDAIIQMRKAWFTQWSDFNFGNALDYKKSQEVY